MSAERPYPDPWAATAPGCPADRPTGGDAGSSLSVLLRCLGDRVEQHQRKIRAQQELIVELVDAVGALAAQLQAQSSGGGAGQEASPPCGRPDVHRDSAYCPHSYLPPKGSEYPPGAPAEQPRRGARRPAWDPTPLRPQPRAKGAPIASAPGRLPRRRSDASTSVAALQAELQRRGTSGRR